MKAVRAEKAAQMRWHYFRQVIAGRAEVSSSTLARSCGLAVEEIRKELQRMGIKDNG